MQKWDGKSKGTPLGYKIFIYTLRLGGVGSAYFLLRFVALYYFFFSWKSSANMLYYFRGRLGYSNLKAYFSLYKNYYTFGQTLIDKVFTMGNMGGAFTFTYEGENYLHKIVDEGRGGLLLSAHIGNWEIAGYYLKRIKTRVNLVMLDAESENIKKYLNSVTGGKDFNIIPLKEDLSHVYQIFEALKNNELVCIHADRYIEGNRSIERNFLGKPAKFPEGVFHLAVLCQVPISFVFAFKENSRHYHFDATPPKVYSGKTKEESKQELVSDYIEALEEKVYLHPTHWFNYYNFWEDK